ncbi:MAG: phage tail domain-containing protein [Anaerovoracaceae bacterium]
MFSWTINSETLQLTGNYRIRNITGLGGAPATIQLQKAPYQDGKTKRDALAEERYITFDLLITGITGDGGNNGYEEILNARRTLANLFNPKLGDGILRWTQSETGKIYDIVATSDGGPEFVDDVNSRFAQRAVISLVAPDPYWYDPAVSHHTVAAFEGGWKFPWKFPLKFGTIGRTLTITNEGDVNTPILLTITGMSNQPRVENLTTGEIIEVNRDIPAGSRIEISTKFGNKYVQLVDSEGNVENAFHWLVSGEDHSLFELVPGENVISYTAVAEDHNTVATIEFYHRYNGI